MRPFFPLIPFLLLVAGTAGCGSKTPAECNPPSGVYKNPIYPNPPAIQRRKLMLIAPQERSAPSPIDDNR